MPKMHTYHNNANYKATAKMAAANTTVRLIPTSDAASLPVVEAVGFAVPDAVWEELVELVVLPAKVAFAIAGSEVDS